MHALICIPLLWRLCDTCLATVGAMCFLCVYIHWVFSYMRIHSLYLRIFRFILCTYAYSDSFSVLTHIPNASSVTAHPMHIRICRTIARKFAECLPCALRSGITYILSDALSLGTQRSGTKLAQCLKAIVLIKCRRCVTV